MDDGGTTSASEVAAVSPMKGANARFTARGKAALARGRLASLVGDMTKDYEFDVAVAAAAAIGAVAAD